MGAPSPERLDTLARRVRWLDIWRRPISVVLGVGLWFAFTHQIDRAFGVPWPNVTSMLASALFAVASWWFIEAAFAWLTAMWEAEHDNIARDRGLPRAELVTRRK